MSRGVGVQILLLAAVTGLLVLITAVAIIVCGVAPAEENGSTDGLGMLIWQSLMHTLDAGTLGGDAGSWTFLFIFPAKGFGVAVSPSKRAHVRLGKQDRVIVLAEDQVSTRTWCAGAPGPTVLHPACMFASFGAVALGLLLGLRHAFEPDHLTAVSTLVIEARDVRRGMLLGAVWGLGHTISLVVVGTLLLATGTVLPERVAAMFELGVAAMLVALGIRSLYRAGRQGHEGVVHAHAHGGTAHTHAAPTRHVHVAGRPLSLRPLAVGLVHGLAGSGAMTAFVFAELPTLAARIVYIGLFGLGSMAGMAFASGVAGASLRRIACSDGQRRSFTFATGVLSITVGVVWAIPQLGLI